MQDYVHKERSKHLQLSIKDKRYLSPKGIFKEKNNNTQHVNRKVEKSLPAIGFIDSLSLYSRLAFDTAFKARY